MGLQTKYRSFLSPFPIAFIELKWSTNPKTDTERANWFHDCSNFEPAQNKYLDIARVLKKHSLNSQLCDGTIFLIFVMLHEHNMKYDSFLIYYKIINC